MRRPHRRRRGRGERRAAAPAGDRGRGDPSRGDPFLRGQLALHRGGRRSIYLVPHSVFSSHRLDRGSLLLLDHLPPGSPRAFLDLGCGYGVLGLEVAGRFPGARGLLVDRDLLAVEFARRNAVLQGAAGVEVVPSLGYRGLPAGWPPFDWILANVPARAGERVLEHFLAGGVTRLAEGGEMRLVAIAPLMCAVERAAGTLGLPFRLEARTSSHAVYSFPRAPLPPAPEPGQEVYERDCIRLRLPEDLRLVRPSDLADEPHRLAHAVPLLASRLPRDLPPGEAPGSVLVFRSGYGLLPALALARFPAARVTATDRDLLAGAFTRLNCASWGDRLAVEEQLRLSGAAGSEAARGGRFDLILGEVSPPLGPRATLEELFEARDALRPGGRALVLCLSKEWRESIQAVSPSLGARLLAVSGPSALLELLTPAPG